MSFFFLLSFSKLEKVLETCFNKILKIRDFI